MRNILKHKILFFALGIILFSSIAVTETKEKAEHEMLPLEFKGTANSLAEGLLRCSSLYTAHEIFGLRICGYTDPKLDIDEFTENEDFKSCRFYEEIKKRSYRASVFRFFLEDLSKEEGFSYEEFLEKSNPQFDQYYMEISETFKSISEKSANPPSISLLLQNDSKAGMEILNIIKQTKQMQKDIQRLKASNRSMRSRQNTQQALKFLYQGRDR